MRPGTLRAWSDGSMDAVDMRATGFVPWIRGLCMVDLAKAHGGGRDVSCTIRYRLFHMACNRAIADPADVIAE